MPAADLIFAREATIRGALRCHRDKLFATLDRRGVATGGLPEDVGVVAFDRHGGDVLWRRQSIPPLAASDDERIYAYGRSGPLVAVGFEGELQWRIELEDDRGESARRKGLQVGPFIADVVPNPGGIALGAGADVLQLDPRDGTVRARTSPCRESRAAILRVAPIRDGILCTCTSRTVQDDQGGPISGGLWDVPWQLESFRTAPADIVALNYDLSERWRARPPQPDLVWANRACARGADGSLGLVASKVARPGALSLFGDELVSLEGSDGRLRWTVPIDGGRSSWDPLASNQGFVSGLPPALYELLDGRLRLRVGKEWAVDPSVSPVIAGSSIYLVEGGRVLSVDVDGGLVSVAADFAPRPLAGAVTSELLVVGDVAYLGVEDAGRRELRAARMRSGGRNRRDIGS